MGDLRAVLKCAGQWLDEGRRVALATVVETRGSAPRQVGSSLVVRDDGVFEGSVSGGCVEGEVVQACLDTIGTGRASLLDFSFDDQKAWQVGLTCGGEVRVMVRRADASLPLGDAARRSPVALVTDLESGASCLVDESGDVVGELELNGDQLEATRLTLARGHSRLDEAQRLFLHVITPPPRMVVIGAVHIAQSLVPMALRSGFEVTVVDPRQAFASEHRFPRDEMGGAEFMTEWPDEALARLGCDRRTAVVVLAHDPKIEDPAIERAIRSEAFYVGALGSTRAHARRKSRLERAGFSPAEIGRIHAPIGLDLGGRAPAEIAVSILAQVIAARYDRARERTVVR